MGMASLRQGGSGEFSPVPRLSKAKNVSAKQNNEVLNALKKQFEELSTEVRAELKAQV